MLSGNGCQKAGKYGEPWAPFNDPAEWNQPELVTADGRRQRNWRREEKFDFMGRAALCVNACEGIEDPADLRRQRDAALKACAEVDRWLMEGWVDADAERTFVNPRFGKALASVRAVLRDAGIKCSGPDVDDDAGASA